MLFIDKEHDVLHPGLQFEVLHGFFISFLKGLQHDDIRFDLRGLLNKLIGIGPGFVTDNFKRSQKNLDELMLVEDEAAYSMVRLIAQKEGLLVGPTSGASAWVAGQLALREEFAGKTIVCFFYDTGERYLSTEGLFRADLIERAQ